MHLQIIRSGKPEISISLPGWILEKLLFYIYCADECEWDHPELALAHEMLIGTCSHIFTRAHTHSTFSVLFCIRTSFSPIYTA